MKYRGKAKLQYHAISSYTPFKIPLMNSTVTAGFPSPADDHLDIPIDLNELKRKSKVIFDANPEIEVVFQSDKDVSFDSVAKAMASVQSIGITKIGIVTSGYENK